MSSSDVPHLVWRVHGDTSTATVCSAEVTAKQSGHLQPVVARCCTWGMRCEVVVGADGKLMDLVFVGSISRASLSLDILQAWS